MFKKICLYAAAFIAIAVYMLSLNETFMRFFTEKLMSTPLKSIRMDKYLYGDLYSMSYLPDYKVHLEPLTDHLRRSPDTVKVIDLWVIGDSFLVPVTPEMADTVLYKTSLKYYYSPNMEGGRTVNISLNSNRKKVLLIERTERFLRGEFDKKKSAKKYLDHFKTDHGVPVVQEAAPPALPSTAAVPAQKKENKPAAPMFKFKWHSPAVTNQNLETILFGYGIFTPVKEWKARVNYRLFDRVNSLVYTSSDKKALYFYETIDPKSDMSSFKELSTEEEEAIVSNMNYIAEEYKKQGFDEVVFSIIPNAVTIGDPGIGPYNNLITKIQNNKGLRAPMIDIYSVFKNSPDIKSLYRRSDTHWSGKGFALWIDAVNVFLKKCADKK